MRRRTRTPLSLLLALPGALLTPGCGVPEQASAEAPVAEDARELYADTTTLWQNSRINVCWENATTANATERAWVQHAAEGTWGAASAVDFAGWGACTSTSRGIRIRISDVGPYTQGLGTRLDGVVDGMVLNFTFANWETGCQTQRQYCIETIAVHEFGHALGFAHEQNRPDTPSPCSNERQGSNGNLTIGAWDLASVMNYCNPQWNGNGVLSATDTAGVVQLYGDALWSRDFSYGGGWYTDQHPRLLADVNADGRADAVGFGDTGVQVALSTGNRFNAIQLWLKSFGATAGSWSVSRHVRTLADVNGDNRADAIGFGDTGVQVALSTGTAFGTPALWQSAFGYNAGWYTDRHVRTLGDVNGDGRDDVVGFGDTGVQVALSTGTGFAAPVLWLRAFGYLEGSWRVDRHVRTVADVNGDGRADVVGFGDTGVQVALSTGTGFAAPGLWLSAFGANAGSWSVSRHVRAMADVNGDGRADAIGFGDPGVQVALSTGTGFAAPGLWLQAFGYNEGGWRTERHVRALGDVNADGRADAAGVGESGIAVHRF